MKPCRRVLPNGDIHPHRRIKGLAAIERDLIEARSARDSTVVHVLVKTCDDVKPRTLRRVQRALARLRVAKERVRRIQGTRQRTLTFDGALWALINKGGGLRGLRRWRKDCDASEAILHDEEVTRRGSAP